ncbi:hypothetical protein VCR15J2_390061 [Vibrio coralliirubri]|uniref:hypothetical protein n=1 Tax=Vibrio coralliirubri TaxID=1516159 RepID=UPI0006317BF6|nr:hypothetical protein [Vibrio coralliirubri]CDT53354.1 hypothetical protein VCR15J2_390061 [Vibrio coralliirubri]
MSELKQLFAFIADNGGDEGEGIVGHHTGEGWMPLVTGKKDIADKMRPLAKRIGELTGKKVKMVSYIREEECDV